MIARTKTARPTPFVYFARGRKSGLIKIGRSVQPTTRVDALKSSYGETATLLFTVPGDYDKEREFHIRFSHLNHRAGPARGVEWFKEEGELAAYIKDMKKQKIAAARNYNNLLPPPVKGTPSEVVLTAQSLGYARVSTHDQVMDVQMTSLKNAGCDRIFAETISAVNAKRPQFNLLMKNLEAGDTVIVYSYSRLSRDLKQLLTIVDILKAGGIKLRSTSEPHIDPYTTHGRMMLSMIGAVDENERNRVKERTKDAMAEKKRQGMYLGAPVKVTPEIAQKMKKLRNSISVTAIAKRFKVSTAAVYTHTR